jgi:hypothetical protein
MLIAIAAKAACEVLKSGNDAPGASRMIPPPNGFPRRELPSDGGRPNKGGGGKQACGAVGHTGDRWRSWRVKRKAKRLSRFR